MSDTLITRDKLQEDLENLYNYKIKPYLNSEGRTVIVKTGIITKEFPEVTFEDLPIQYENMFDVYTSAGLNYIAIDTSVPSECTVTYDENDIQENQEVEVVLRTEMIISSGAIITGIAVTTPPRRVNYATGYALDLTKVYVTGYFTDGIESKMNSAVTFDPPNGTILNDVNLNKVTVTFHNFITSFDIHVAARKTLAALPFKFGGGCIVTLNNEIHLLGERWYQGYNGYWNGNLRLHYKWNGSSWVSVSTLPYDFYQGSAVVLNNEIHILGGQGVSTNHYKWNGISWSWVSTLPYSYYNADTAIVYNDEIHILGGVGGTTNHYKFDGTSWIYVSTLPYSPGYGMHSVLYNNEIHLLGGSSTLRNHYAWNGISWYSVSSLPIDYYCGGCVYYNADNDNEIYIFYNTNCYAWNGTNWYYKTTVPQSGDYYANSFYNNYTNHATIWNNGVDYEVVLGGGMYSGYRNYTYGARICWQYNGYDWLVYYAY